MFYDKEGCWRLLSPRRRRGAFCLLVSFGTLAAPPRAAAKLSPGQFDHLSSSATFQPQHPDALAVAAGALRERVTISQTLSGPHRSAPRLTAAKRCAAARPQRTVLCGTVIRCARALSAADTIQRCMLRERSSAAAPAPRDAQGPGVHRRRRRMARARRPCSCRRVVMTSRTLCSLSDRISVDPQVASFPGGHTSSTRRRTGGVAGSARKFGPDFESLRGRGGREVLAVTGTVVTPVVACVLVLWIWGGTLSKEDEVRGLFVTGGAFTGCVNREERMYENRGRLPVFRRSRGMGADRDVLDGGWRSVAALRQRAGGVRAPRGERV